MPAPMLTSSSAPSLAGQFPLTNHRSKPAECDDDFLLSGVSTPVVTSLLRDPADVIRALSRACQSVEVCRGVAIDAQTTIESRGNRRTVSPGDTGFSQMSNP